MLLWTGLEKWTPWSPRCLVWDSARVCSSGCVWMYGAAKLWSPALHGSPPPPTLSHSDFGPTPANSAALLSAADIFPSRRCLRNVWPGSGPASQSETQGMQTGNKPALLFWWKNILPLQIQFPLKHTACFSKYQSNVFGRNTKRACQTGIE